MSEFLKQLTTLELILAPLCILLSILCFAQYCRLGKVMSGNWAWHHVADKNRELYEAVKEDSERLYRKFRAAETECNTLREEQRALSQFIWGSAGTRIKTHEDVLSYIAGLRTERAQACNKSAMLAEALTKYSEQLREIQRARISNPEDVTA